MRGAAIKHASRHRLPSPNLTERRKLVGARQNATNPQLAHQLPTSPDQNRSACASAEAPARLEPPQGFVMASAKGKHAGTISE